jgi:hypothetical protein
LKTDTRHVLDTHVAMQSVPYLPSVPELCLEDVVLCFLVLLYPHWLLVLFQRFSEEVYRYVFFGLRGPRSEGSVALVFSSFGLYPWAKKSEYGFPGQDKLFQQAFSESLFFLCMVSDLLHEPSFLDPCPGA